MITDLVVFIALMLTMVGAIAWMIVSRLRSENQANQYYADDLDDIYDDEELHETKLSHTYHVKNTTTKVLGPSAHDLYVNSLMSVSAPYRLFLLRKK